MEPICCPGGVTNAKNRLKELLERRGWTLDDVGFERAPDPAGWRTTATLRLPGLPFASATGTGRRMSHADVVACAGLLERVDVGDAEDEGRLQRDAQAGDALVKLAAYVCEELGTAAGAARWLTAAESDRALAGVFDRWRDAGVAEVCTYGPGLGEKRRATLVEALLWRCYRDRVLGVGADRALAELRADLGAGFQAPPARAARAG